jgi:hypothetical protein
MADLMEGIGVGPGNETASHHGDIQLFLVFSHFPLDLQNIRRRPALTAQTFAVQMFAPWLPRARCRPHCLPEFHK